MLSGERKTPKQEEHLDTKIVGSITCASSISGSVVGLTIATGIKSSTAYIGGLLGGVFGCCISSACLVGVHKYSQKSRVAEDKIEMPTPPAPIANPVQNEIATKPKAAIATSSINDREAMVQTLLGTSPTNFNEEPEFFYHRMMT